MVLRRFKKKIVIKKRKNKESQYYLFKYNSLDYYINPENNNTYDKEGNFVGIKEDDIINFDMEEAE